MSSTFLESDVGVLSASALLSVSGFWKVVSVSVAFAGGAFEGSEIEKPALPCSSKAFA